MRKIILLDFLRNSSPGFLQNTNKSENVLGGNRNHSGKKATSRYYDDVTYFFSKTINEQIIISTSQLRITVVNTLQPPINVYEITPKKWNKNYISYLFRNYPVIYFLEEDVAENCAKSWLPSLLQKIL